MADAAHPFDHYADQLAGRLLTLEALVTLLLRETASGPGLLAAAGDRLAQLESVAAGPNPSAETRDQVLHMFEAARESLDRIHAGARR